MVTIARVRWASFRSKTGSRINLDPSSLELKGEFSSSLSSSALRLRAALHP